jgi:hypothetical protein
MWCIHLSLYIANLRLAGDASSESPLTVPQHGSRTLTLMTENPRRLDIPETCHPNTWAIYRYWQEKCRGRSMPARSDLDPLDMPKGLLPGLCLVDVAPDERRYVYRLVGTADVEVRGYDPTGKSVIEWLLWPLGRRCARKLRSCGFVSGSTHRSAAFQGDQWPLCDRGNDFSSAVR